MKEMKEMLWSFQMEVAEKGIDKKALYHSYEEKIIGTGFIKTMKYVTLQGTPLNLLKKLYNASNPEELLPEDPEFVFHMPAEGKTEFPEASKKSRATINFLALVSRATYRLSDGNPEVGDGIDISEHGYTVLPQESKGNTSTHFSAMVLKPNDGKAPIIIAFRGSIDSHDYLVSDPLAYTRGVVEKGLRDEVFAYYHTVRLANPESEIILTGHSLGGHFAQYVAAKAYNTDPVLRKNPKVLVRTFNTVPVNTKHGAIFKSHPELAALILHYRLQTDSLSALPLQENLGFTFDFLCEVNNFIRAHNLDTILSTIPQDILNQTIGTTQEFTQAEAALIEFTNGFLQCYQCKIDEQFFAGFRRGKGNLDVLHNALTQVVASLKAKNYESAVKTLGACKGQLNGQDSIKKVDFLLKNLGTIGLAERTLSNLKKIIYERNDRSIHYEDKALAQESTQFDDRDIAGLLFRYCALNFDKKQVASIISDKDHGSLMLKNLDLLTTPDPVLLEALWNYRKNEMTTKQERLQAASNLSKFWSATKETVSGKNYGQQLKWLTELRKGDGFADVEAIREVQEKVNAATSFNPKTKNLITAILKLQIAKQPNSLGINPVAPLTEPETDEPGIPLSVFLNN